MKKFKKNLIALALALVLVLSPTAQSFAAEELPTEAVYDIEKGGTQTFTIRDPEDGSIHTVTVKELTNGNSRVANGSYEVGYHCPAVWIASFIIDVKTNQIYNAHTPYSYAYRGTIKYPIISRPSTTHASLSFIYELNKINYTTGIDAKITYGEIVISKR